MLSALIRSATRLQRSALDEAMGASHLTLQLTVVTFVITVNCVLAEVSARLSRSWCPVKSGSKSQEHLYRILQVFTVN